jgi:hypothetical protein
MVAKRSAVAAAVGFVGYAAYQLALAAGAPLGRGAWGGTQTQLPTSLRLGSAVAVAVYGVAALIVLRRAGYGIRWISPTVARVGTWVLVVVLTLSALINFLSPSPWERFLNGPMALVLAALCLFLTRGAHGTINPSSDAPERMKRPTIRGSV